MAPLIVKSRLASVFLFRPRNFTRRDFSNNLFCGLMVRVEVRVCVRVRVSVTVRVRVSQGSGVAEWASG